MSSSLKSRRPASTSRRNSTIEITIERPVPKVVGRRAEDALEWLKKEGFKVAGPEGTQRSDIVAEQHPAAGSTLDPGGSVKLVRVETIVPDLAGSSLANAKTAAEAEEILNDRQLKLRVLEPTTTYGRAKVLKQSPAFGKRIDRASQAVEISLVVPVPAIPSSQRLADAIKTVNARTLGATLSSKKAKDDDFVIDVDVLAERSKQYRVGGTTYVSPKERLLLIVGRKVPTIDRLSWSDGLKKLSDVELESSFPLGAGTHVHSTSPAPGQAGPTSARRSRSMPELRFRASTATRWKKPAANWPAPACVQRPPV